MKTRVRRPLLCVLSTLLAGGYLLNTRFNGIASSIIPNEPTVESTFSIADENHHHSHPIIIIDIVSIGSNTRPDYLQTQQDTFGRHSSVRHFFAITEQDDIEQDCNNQLTWLDVQNISGFCGGLRRDIRIKHKLLYALKVKFAKPQWLERKPNPVAWMCAQKRPMAGFQKALQHYKTQNEPLPHFMILMDDDTYYNLNRVVPNLLQLQREQLQNYNDDSMVLTGCLIRSKLEIFKWFFPYGGWGTIFSKGALQSLMEPLHCNTTTNSNWSRTMCPQLQRDRIGEYQVYQEGMSLAEIMNAYTFQEPYTQQKHWKLGFCLHSDWVWGYFSNYYNISVAMGRRSHELKVDRIGAYNMSEMNAYDPEDARDLRRQCEFKSNDNCTVDAHMCHYITPDYMKHLWSQQEAEP